MLYYNWEIAASYPRFVHLTAFLLHTALQCDILISEKRLKGRADMTILLFTVLAVTEAAFLISQFSAAAEKRIWNKKRLLVNLMELAAFGLMLLLPDIDLSFRFTGLLLILVIRLLFAGISFLLHRKNSKIKTKPGKIMSCILSMMLLAFAMAPAFLFKNYQGRPLTGAYTPAECSAILTDAARTEQYEQDGSKREIPVHIFYPAEADRIAAHSLPLVVFSHGAFGWYQSNMSAYLELASNGYVVVSMEHPYHSLFTKDTSGRLITVDTAFMQTAMALGSSNTEDTEKESVYQTECEWMKLREDDMNFTVDTLKSAADNSDFAAWTFTGSTQKQTETALNMVNTEKIGLMGHSLGGATAVTVGRRADIAAAIDIDGTMLGEQTGFADGKYVVNTAPYSTPLLSIDNEAHHNDRLEALKTGYVYANNVVLDHAEAAYETYFAGAGHMNFTDLPLISPFFAKQLGTGTINPETCTDTLNKLILDFFNCYLKDEGDFSVQEHY